MKKILRNIWFLSAVMCMLLLSACEIVTYDNGKLDGFWHMEQIDTIATGGVKDMSGEVYFWAVQSKILEVSDRTTIDRIIFRFKDENNKLSLYDARISDRTIGDPLIQDVDLLRPFGVNALEEEFDIEALDGGKMVLRSETLRIRFRKF